MTETAIVFDIQRNSLEDGPGIRTTVFLKGCCMRCRWCHNPESFEQRPQQVTLPNGRVRIYGEMMSVEDVFKVVVLDQPFFKVSGGGVTVGGGEPFLQYDFLMSLLKSCKEEAIHTAVETNGFPPWGNYEPVLAYTDLLLFDYKATPSKLHTELTGVPLEPVLERLDALIRAGKELILRCPIIPGVNDQEEHLQAIAALSRRYGIKVQIMPYHNTARDKWNALHIPYSLAGLPSMQEHDVSQVIAKIVSYGCHEDLISLP
jgi:pyruvate formate lyase activating enzyme